MKAVNVKALRTPSDIDEAIRAFSDADWHRLRKVAKLYARNKALEAEDLLQEAFHRALKGSRNCPKNVDVVHFLCEVMRSIASGEMSTYEHALKYVSLVTEREGDTTELSLPSSDPDPEQQVRSAEEVSRIRDKMFELFGDDEQAALVLLGIIDGMEGEELQKEVDIDLKTLATKRKLIRRRIDAASPNGWTS